MKESKIKRNKNMKKIIVTITLSFIMCVMFLGSASAVSWSSSESLAIPSWVL